jgi:hypothetical protein
MTRKLGADFIAEPHQFRGENVGVLAVVIDDEDATFHQFQCNTRNMCGVGPICVSGWINQLSSAKKRFDPSVEADGTDPLTRLALTSCLKTSLSGGFYPESAGYGARFFVITDN